MARPCYCYEVELLDCEFLLYINLIGNNSHVTKGDEGCRRLRGWKVFDGIESSVCKLFDGFESYAGRLFVGFDE